MLCCTYASKWVRKSYAVSATTPLVNWEFFLFLRWPLCLILFVLLTTLVYWAFGPLCLCHPTGMKNLCFELNHEAERCPFTIWVATYREDMKILFCAFRENFPDWAKHKLRSFKRFEKMEVKPFFFFYYGAWIWICVHCLCNFLK